MKEKIKNAIGNVMSNSKVQNLPAIAMTTGSALLAMMGSAGASSADDLTTSLQGVMEEIYSKILYLSTGILVVVGAIALVMMMVSNNQKTVDGAKSWLKRVVIAWFGLNSLALIAKYLTGKFNFDTTIDWVER